MSLTHLTIRSDSMVAVAGDSRSTETTVGDIQNLSRVWVPIKAACNAGLRALSASDAPRPVPWLNWAVDGQTTALAAAGLAANLALNVPTHIIYYLSINDVRASVLQATTITNISTYLTAAFAAGVEEIMVIPADFSGELWSVGDAGNPNTFDAAIKSLLAALEATVTAFPGALWFNNRTAFFNVNEPIYNAPVPGAAGEILTQDSIGLHHNSRGTALQAAAWLDVIQFERS